jgi:hypothetical protein
MLSAKPVISNLALRGVGSCPYEPEANIALVLSAPKAGTHYSMIPAFQHSIPYNNSRSIKALTVNHVNRSGVNLTLTVNNFKRKTKVPDLNGLWQFS